MKIEIVIEPADEELQSPELPEVTRLWEIIGKPDMVQLTSFQLAITSAIREYMKQQGLEGRFSVEGFTVEFGPALKELIKASGNPQPRPLETLLSELHAAMELKERALVPGVEAIGDFLYSLSTEEAKALEEHSARVTALMNERLGPIIEEFKDMGTDE